MSAAQRAVLLTRSNGSAIALNDGHDTRCRAVAGEIALPVGSRIHSQSGLTGACLRSGRVMRCDRTDSDPEVDRETCRRLGIGSVLAAPIVHGGSVVGLIEVFSRQSHAFDNSDSYALERLAETVADSMTASRWLGQERADLLLGPAVSIGIAPLSWWFCAIGIGRAQANPERRGFAFPTRPSLPKQGALYAFALSFICVTHP